MAGLLRRAGQLAFEDGQSVTWSVAEGRRGRRWREAVRKPDQSGIRHSLLLEMDPAGWFAHLELSTAAGLLTLHPEGDGTLHGNVVRSTGIEHIRGIPWDAHGVVLIDASPISRLAAFPGLSTMIGSGESASVRVLRVPADLRLAVGIEEIQRLDRGPDRRWSLRGSEHMTVEEDGLLRGSSDADWPLEEGET